jgi:hypothetical protein
MLSESVCENRVTMQDIWPAIFHLPCLTEAVVEMTTSDLLLFLVVYCGEPELNVYYYNVDGMCIQWKEKEPFSKTCSLYVRLYDHPNLCGRI